MIKTVAILLSVIIFLFVIELVRRRRLTFKYALGWLVMSSVGVVFAVFDRWIYGLSALLGFKVPSNFIFFSVICCFVFLSLFLTIFLCQQNERNDTMAQKIGIIELELKELKKKNKES